MATDINEYVAAFPTCAHNKGTNGASPGLLQPLSTPHHMWSHIYIDFVTGLPPSDGNTTILTVGDCFYKIVHFIPSKKLPSAREAAELMLHVFRLHAFPVDVVSDMGPRFISQFWCFGAFWG